MKCHRCLTVILYRLYNIRCLTPIPVFYSVNFWEETLNSLFRHLRLMLVLWALLIISTLLAPFTTQAVMWTDDCSQIVKKKCFNQRYRKRSFHFVSEMVFLERGEGDMRAGSSPAVERVLSMHKHSVSWEELCISFPWFIHRFLCNMIEHRVYLYLCSVYRTIERAN